MADEKIAKKIMPRGTPKGGSRYPRHTLSDALVWGRKLVTKTHLGPQTEGVVLSGVVGSSSSHGKVRISTLRQFGLLEGKSSAYTATPLAREISSCPEDEVVNLYRQCALTPPIFKDLYNTFQGDLLSKAKLKQRAANLGVHPDAAGDCVEIYVSTAALAGLCSVEGEDVSHVAQQPNKAADFDLGENSTPTISDPAIDDPETAALSLPRNSGKSNVNVQINIDSSMDAEKLEKQLRLLKMYGAL